MNCGCVTAKAMSRPIRAPAIRLDALTPWLRGCVAASGSDRSTKWPRPDSADAAPQTKTATRRWPFAHRDAAGLLGGGFCGSLRGGTRLGVAGEVFLDARLAAFQPTQ